jgi:hypothetical protein
MTRESYMREWGDDPATWPKIVHQYEFDWQTPDVVFVAEFYRIEDTKETLRIFQAIDGSEERYLDSELDEETLTTLNAVGTVEVRQRKVKRKRARKYIMSGGRVLEDAGYLAGKCIPVIPVYGKRWFIDNIERCSGHVRLAKDAQRLKNMQLSKLAEISALSSMEKPILTPEQVAGHQIMWSEDNIKNYPYLLINPITGADGSTQVGGPVAYTKSAAVPPALAGLLQITEQDIRDVLGNQEQGDKIVSNISGTAVEMVQQRLDMQSYIYMSNMAKAIRRCGEVWLSMAKELYVEPKRKMKGIGPQNQIEMVELMKPVIGEEGELRYEGDLSTAHFDVAVDVGPSFRSQREAIVRSLINLVAVTQDPQTQQVLQAMIIMNMEGEGLQDARDFFRKKLVEIGVLKPNEEEAAAMAEAAANAPPDPNAVFVQAAAEKAMAEAESERADAMKKMAETQLTQAKTVETLSKVGEGSATNNGQSELTAAMQSAVAGLGQSAAVIGDAVGKMSAAVGQLADTSRINTDNTIAAISRPIAGLGQSAVVIGDAVNKMSAAVGQFADTSRVNTDKAIAAISRPKRVVREKGRIARIETE